MKAQLSHAIKSFKSQKHITISILKAQVETAFNNAIDKEDLGWLIQWVISHKLVCHIIFFLFQTLIYWPGAQIVLLFPNVKHQPMGCYFFHLYLYNTNSSSDINDTLVSDPQNQNRKRRATCTILILWMALLEMFTKMVLQCFKWLITYLELSCNNPKFHAVKPSPPG